MILGNRLSSDKHVGWYFGVLAVLVAILEAASPATQAAEIKVLSPPGLIGAFKEIVPKFESTTGHKLLISFEALGPMMRRIDSGERFDVVIITTSEMNNLINRGKIVADSRLDLARVGIGVWIRPEAPKPDISSVDAFKRMLLEAKSISYTKESGTGVYVAELMERLGIADIMRPKTRFVGGGGESQRLVAAGEVQYGISVVSDGIGRPGIELLGVLPQEIQRWAVWAGGVTLDASEPAAARSFLKFLASPDAVMVMRANGLELPAQ